MTVQVAGYTVHTGTNEEPYQISAQVNYPGSNAAYEALMWTLADEMKATQESLYPTMTFINGVVRHEKEDVVLTHP